MIQSRPSLEAKKKRFGIIASRFNEFVVKMLIEGCTDVLLQHGAREDDIFLARVPGAFEIPLACKELAETHRYHALIALGTVIKGDTPHFDYVAAQSASGLLTVSLEYRIPLAYGILTTENIEQAIERAGCKAGNKGRDAALVAIEMANFNEQIRSTHPGTDNTVSDSGS